jgi:hypothetical protein
MCHPCALDFHSSDGHEKVCLLYCGRFVLGVLRVVAFLL